ncbi:MAG TPA: HAMP domain-containing sensor histidine kinase, partial [Planctomycetia bacterium]|nr:HAMP domain-containing sensor histidine kinase [Planctomycetia bacterium]
LNQLRRQDRYLFGLVGVFAGVGLLAVVAELFRRRERARRLRSQQITLDLARQMCHELRNGLWAFSLEGKNLRHYFDVSKRFLAARGPALGEAAVAVGLSPEQSAKLARAEARRLRDAGLDPDSDLDAGLALATEAYAHIESFAKYLHLTVEELDRHLLGRSATFEPTLFDPADAWREAVGLLGMRLRGAGVETAVSGSAALVRADRRDLVHVFVNLIKNAVEAMHDSPPPRLVELQSATGHGGVVLTVRNGGPPIPAEVLPHLFRRGFSTKPGAGRGAGLAIVQESVERSGGTIQAQSPGEGVAIVLRFPEPRLPG